MVEDEAQETGSEPEPLLPDESPGQQSGHNSLAGAPPFALATGKR